MPIQLTNAFKKIELAPIELANAYGDTNSIGNCVQDELVHALVSYTQPPIEFVSPSTCHPVLSIQLVPSYAVINSVDASSNF